MIKETTETADEPFAALKAFGVQTVLSANDVIGGICTVPQKLLSVMPITSFDTKSREGSVSAFNATCREDFDVSEVLGSEIEVQDYVLYPILLPGDGENQSKQVVRCCLVSPDGSRYGCSSDGIISALARVYSFMRPAPWIPPLKIVPFEGKSRNGYRYLSFELAK